MVLSDAEAEFGSDNEADDDTRHLFEPLSPLGLRRGLALAPLHLCSFVSRLRAFAKYCAVHQYAVDNVKSLTQHLHT